MSLGLLDTDFNLSNKAYKAKVWSIFQTSSRVFDYSHPKIWTMTSSHPRPVGLHPKSSDKSKIKQIHKLYSHFSLQRLTRTKLPFAKTFPILYLARSGIGIPYSSPKITNHRKQKQVESRSLIINIFTPVREYTTNEMRDIRKVFIQYNSSHITQISLDLN